MYTLNLPFQISKYATGWGGGATQTFAPGSKYPRAATVFGSRMGFPAELRFLP